MHPVRTFGAPIRNLDTMSRGRSGKTLASDSVDVLPSLSGLVFIATAAVSATSVKDHGVGHTRGAAYHYQPTSN